MMVKIGAIINGEINEVLVDNNLVVNIKLNTEDNLQFRI